MEIQGRCHCGNIQYVLDWPGAAPAIPARRCTCSYCTAHGARWAAHPHARLRVVVVDAQRIIRYRFGTQTAEFFACGTCAVLILATSQVDRQVFAAVNASTFDAGPEIDVTAVCFEDEAKANRLDRRRQNWIGDFQGP